MSGLPPFHQSPPPALADELAALGHRLSVISAQLRAQQQPRVAPQTTPPHHYQAPAQPWRPPTGTVAPPPRPLPPAPPVAATPGAARSDRTGAGGRLLPWVGGVVTLLGLVLLLGLAIERGWLGPLPRIIGGAALALALIGVAFWVRRTPSGAVGGVVVAATGFAGLYLDVVAATAYYEYLPTAGGLAVGLLIAGGGVALSARWRAEPLAVAVVAGAAAFGPTLTGLDPVPLIGFLLALQLGALPVQLWRRWTVLPVLAALPPVLAAAVLAIDAPLASGDPADLATTLSVSAATAGSLLVALLGAARNRPPRAVDAASTAVLIATPLPVLLLAPSVSIPAGVLVLAVPALVLAVTWMLGEGGRLHREFGLLAGGLAALSTVELLVVAVDGGSLAAALLGEATAVLALAWWLRSRAVLIGAAVVSATGTIAALLLAVPPTVLARFGEEPYFTGGTADVGALALGVLVGAELVVLAAGGAWVARGLNVSAGPLWVVCGAVLLYGAAAATDAIALLIAPTRAGFLAGHAAITVSWTVAALVVLAVGLRPALRQAEWLRWVGLALVASAVAKLVLFDLAALDGVARVAAFLGAGLVLLAAGTRYTRMLAETDAGGAPARHDAGGAHAHRRQGPGGTPAGQP